MREKTIRTLSGLLETGHITEDALPALEAVVSTLPVSLTNAMSQLINPSDACDPIRQQFVPSVQELHIEAHELSDPIGDQAHQTVKGVVHRYQDRCLFMPVQVCAVYCRFCFRRETVGHSDATLTEVERDAAYAYIAAHPDIWEVILTGGDPLILKPAMLQTMLARLSAISHVNVLRIHTRIPIVDPDRITDDMLQALTLKKPLYIAIHANHANEFSEKAILAIQKLITHGVTLISQTTLLKGINDNINALSDLMRMFVKHRIKPYYLHHADLVRGTSHFRTSIQEGQALMRALRGRFSGLCQPTYVLDIPGGFGKVPVGPRYLSDDYQTVCDHNNKSHRYE